MSTPSSSACGEQVSDAKLRGVYLSGANLRGANLASAKIEGANLEGANLEGANLSYANLAGANLEGANLSFANLAGANLEGANLSYATFRYASLSYTNLRGAIGLPIAEDAPARLLAVAHAALAIDDALEMSDWHTCETTHRICGWAEHLGGPLARLLFKINGNDFGGLMLLGVEAHAHFYKSNEEGRAFLQSVIDNARVAETAPEPQQEAA